MRNPSNSRMYLNSITAEDWHRHFIILKISSLDLIRKIKNYFDGKNQFPNSEISKMITMLDEASKKMAAEIILSRCKDLPDHHLDIIKRVIDRCSNITIVQNEKK